MTDFNWLALTWFDLVAIAILLVSVVIAIVRGLIRELISLSAWIGALLAVILVTPRLAPFIQQQIGAEDLAAGMAASLAFLAGFLIVSLPGQVLARAIGTHPAGLAGLVLSSLFGAARGGLVVCLIYLAARWILTEQGLPAEISEAVLHPVISTLSDAGIGLLPPEWFTQPLDQTARDGQVIISDQLPALEEISDQELSSDTAIVPESGGANQ